MSPNFKLQCHFTLILLTALRGESRYLEVQEAAVYDPFLLFSANLKRNLAEEQPYRRALRCLDMLSLPGQFTFTADQPQLHCAAFFIGEPEEFITIHFDLVSIDCQGGDFLKVFDGWILKGEKFPSSQDHPLPTRERYTDFCESGLTRRSVTSSQNVAMVFFRVHEPGNGFTITIKTDPNLFPCNIISQTPSGRFTLVVPYQHQNCSFSIIYPVTIKISDLALGHLHGLQLKKPAAGCGGTGDFVELLGGTGLDTSKMMLLVDLCYPFHGPAQMKISCDNAVVRMVSSGKHMNRVTFEYRQLEPLELETSTRNSIPEYCLSSL
ncbi:corticotropin releasing hormone binding protein [Rattus norvegicus]|uniref:Corticotropin-releasing factor-binding protein n=2 Tax=Rattus norvegicus TaxID=10116 RepID=F7EU31_RAT|nr:corticotropin-releasing factor-binding protein precursor [Rattus norvegicus]AAB65241.1 CRH-binding protein [Rattus norvegicus]EDM10099.1 corticotropin releasing hormone binding protein [Rattus norvegicus]|eukprot:NP_631922.1 corticotropin-releasing factor-binding protein precursor [Rattus norvegicus]